VPLLCVLSAIFSEYLPMTIGEIMSNVYNVFDMC
jgi:hypothetical protein